MKKNKRSNWNMPSKRAVLIKDILPPPKKIDFSRIKLTREEKRISDALNRGEYKSVSKKNSKKLLVH